MKKLLKVTAMTAMLTLFRMAMGFVIAKVVAVYTGPSGMAMLGQVQSMVISLNGIVNSPAGSGIVRYTAEHKNEGYEACAPWWNACLRWIVIILSIIIPLGLLFSEYLSQWLFFSSDYAWLITVTICVLPFTAMGTLINSVINGQQQYRRYILLGTVSVFVSGSVMIGLIIQHNLTGALLAASLQAGIIGLVMTISSLNQPWFKLRYWWGKSNRKERKDIGAYILMAITSALTVPISLVLIRNILVAEVGWEQAGQWQAVWKISEVYLGVITMALGTYYLPKLSSLKGSLAINNEINQTVKIILPIVISLALSIYFLRDLVITLLFTEAFRSARDLFAIQLIGDVVKIISWLYAYPMLSRGITKFFILTEVVFSILFVFLSYVFISIYGVIGANVAYLVNYIICTIYIIFIIKPSQR
ncbi:O-antigen translocase [Pectobacterium polaris]|uniref:O-antigen translocase n=1 Tax=Pectobacterium polaris TaxID=2042057 RepID=UPI0013FD4692|nr:O-antigen translocase [Pectobacterium polaris]